MSLFANLGNSSLTGNAASGANPGAQTGSSLFGNLGQSSTTASQTGGLFSTAKPSASGPSLFGASSAAPLAGTSQQVNAPSLFGASSTTAFGQQQQQQPQQQGQQSQQPQTQQSESKPSQAAYFDHLLERGKKRAIEQNGTTKLNNIPSLQLGLGDIARKVRNLGNGGPSAALSRSTGDTKAHYLLAASGVNTATTLRDLNDFTAQTGASVGGTQSSRSAAYDLDIDSYVDSLRHQSTLDLIAEGLEQSKRDFDAFLEENVHLEWDKQRRRIYEHFGLTRKEDTAPADGGPVQEGTGAFGRSSRRNRGFGKASLAASMGLGGSGLARSIIGVPKSGDGRASILGDNSERNINVPAGASNDDRFMRERQSKFAQQVRQLNAKRNKEDSFPILQEFCKVEQEAGMESVQPLVDSYRALILMTDEKPESMPYAWPQTMRQRCYRETYEEAELPNSSKGLGLKKRIIDGSRRFLERQFLDQLTTVVNKNPQEAQLGGVPSVTDKIRGYVRILAARKELGSDNVTLQKINEDYCFVIIYVLMRCGLLDDAKKYVQDNQRALQHIDRNFSRYMSAYADSASEDRQLGPELRQRVQTEFLSLTKIAPERTADPYRVACYKIMGRCDLTRRSLEGVGGNWEDWIWLQFALAREQNLAETSAKDVFGLKDLREMVEDIGSRHFQSGASNELGGYGTYFMLQVLVGRFEYAIDWLYKHDTVAAVHFAIALDYYGLLRIADWSAPQELLTLTPRQWPQIQFGLMLGYYTAPFRTAHPLDAVEYLTLIAMNADAPGELGNQQKQFCWEALRELVLETREFAALLGDVQSNGQLIRGAITLRKKLLHLEDNEDFVRTITVQAASMADEAGRVTDAVLLYHLADQYDAVITIINRALSEAFCVEPGSEPLKLEPLKPAQSSAAQAGNGQQAQTFSLSLTSVDDPLSLARTMFSLYGNDQLKHDAVVPQNWESCQLLGQMFSAKQLVEQGRWEDACQAVAVVNLIPLKITATQIAPPNPKALTKPNSQTAPASDNIATIRDRASLLSSLPAPLANAIPMLLILTLTALGRWREQIKGSSFVQGNDTRQGLLSDLARAGRDLMIYAGMVRYKMPAKVFEKLSEVTEGDDA